MITGLLPAFLRSLSDTGSESRVISCFAISSQIDARAGEVHSTKTRPRLSCTRIPLPEISAMAATRLFNPCPSASSWESCAWTLAPRSCNAARWLINIVSSTRWVSMRSWSPVTTATGRSAGSLVFAGGFPPSKMMADTPFCCALSRFSELASRDGIRRTSLVPASFIEVANHPIWTSRPGSADSQLIGSENARRESSLRLKDCPSISFFEHLPGDHPLNLSPFSFSW